MATPKIIELTNHTIHEASSAEIRAFALDACGLEFSEDAARQNMIEAVIEAQGWLQKDPEEGATHVEITIGKEAGVEGDLPYQGGASGEMFSIKRGVKVVIPIRYWESIKSTQRRAGFTIVPLTDMKEGAPSEERIPRAGYPIQVHRYLIKE